MWAKVDNNKVTRIYAHPEWLKDGSGTAHPPSTFKNTTSLASFSIHPVVMTNAPPNHRELYKSGDITYAWKSSKKIVEATHSYPLKAMADVNDTWTQTEIDSGNAPAGTKKGDNKLDENGHQIVILGIRSLLINEVKNRESSLLLQTDKWIVRKAEKTTAIPSTVKSWRDAIRAKATTMETAITNATDSDAILVLLRPTYDSADPPKVTAPAVLYDYPVPPEGMPQ
tara:strand:- start:1446 stop:2123 length:678 start_codon:yes stop_codon:yes gene_type:complete